jgi:hypothetical protein
MFFFEVLFFLQFFFYYYVNIELFDNSDKLVYDFVFVFYISLFIVITIFILFKLFLELMIPYLNFFFILALFWHQFLFSARGGV